jgi:hypothetical protein
VGNSDNGMVLVFKGVIGISGKSVFKQKKKE